MLKDELVDKVLAAVNGDKEAIRKLVDALVSKDAQEIQRVFSSVAKVDLAPGEADALVQELGPDPLNAVGYAT